MSVCVRIRTGKILSPEEVFNALESNGNQILVTSNEWPNLKMGIIRKALRGIKINKEDNGYEIRLCTFGSFDDNLLFRNVIKLLLPLTEGHAFYEDNDDEPITDPEESSPSLKAVWFLQESRVTLLRDCCKPSLLKMKSMPMGSDLIAFKAE